MGGCCLLPTHLLGACMGGCCLLLTHLLGILLIWWCMHGWVLLVAYSSAWYLADLVVHAWVGVA